MRFFTFCLAAIFSVGCGSGGKKEELKTADSPAANSSAMLRQRSNRDPLASTSQRKLGAGEVRVALLVLPGDALVEVDKVPVRRRNGLIELVGTVGEQHRVDVFWGANTKIEKTVEIEATGVSPAFIDAEEESKVKVGPAKAPAVFDNDE